MKQRPIAEQDVFRFLIPSDAQISPDGTRVAFVVQRADQEENAYFQNLWVSGTEGDSNRAFTIGAVRDTQPRWAPDGSAIYFTSDRGGTQQVWRIPSDGGEAAQLTDLAEGKILELAPSPDGRRLAFAYRPIPSAFTREASEQRSAKKRSTPPQVITRLKYREEGAGYVGDEYARIYVCGNAGEDARPVSPDDRPASSIAWSPDGRRLACVVPAGDDPERTPQVQEIRLLTPEDPAGSETVNAPPGSKHHLAWSPCGTRLAWIGHTDTRDLWSASDPHLWVTELEGGDSVDLCGELDRPAGDAGLGDLLPSGGWDGPSWTPNGRAILCPVSTHGRTHVFRFALDGSEPVDLTPDLNGAVSSLSLAADCRAAVIAGDATHPAEVWAGTIGPHASALQARRLTALNDELLSEIEIIEPEEFHAPRPGGVVHGWLLRARGEAPKPLLLYIHGGPHTQYGVQLMHELQWLASEGFTVLYTNPRGSRGYGQEHVEAIRGNWGGPDFEDLMAAVDHAVTDPRIDPNRLAVTGGSYGGYMTNWILGHSDRFRCGVTQRSVVNLHSMSNTCDFNFSDSDYFGGAVCVNPQRLVDQSPLTYAASITAPLLIIHSEGDLRCPIEQAEQLYGALRRLGREVVLVRYPKEANHGLSRSGPPDLRLDRLVRIRDWLVRWLLHPRS